MEQATAYLTMREGEPPSDKGSLRSRGPSGGSLDLRLPTAVEKAKTVLENRNKALNETAKKIQSQMELGQDPDVIRDTARQGEVLLKALVKLWGSLEGLASPEEKQELGSVVLDTEASFQGLLQSVETYKGRGSELSGDVSDVELKLEALEREIANEAPGGFSGTDLPRQTESERQKVVNFLRKSKPPNRHWIREMIELGDPNPWDVDGDRRPTIKSKLTTFEGNILDWPGFLDMFKALVHQTRLDPAEKLAHLKASLGQGQRSLIRHCNGHDGYVKALSILDGRYGDPDQLQARYLRELKALPKVRMEDSDSIQEYADQVLCLIAGFDEELGGSRLLIEELAEKLPLSEYANWRQWSDVEEKSNLEGFGEWISLRAKYFRRIAMEQATAYLTMREGEPPSDKGSLRSRGPSGGSLDLRLPTAVEKAKTVLENRNKALNETAKKIQSQMELGQDPDVIRDTARQGEVLLKALVKLWGSLEGLASPEEKQELGSVVLDTKARFQGLLQSVETYKGRGSELSGDVSDVELKLEALEREIANEAPGGFSGTDLPRQTESERQKVVNFLRKSKPPNRHWIREMIELGDPNPWDVDGDRRPTIKSKLTTFEGNILDWPGFLDMFKALVHQTRLDPAEKLAHLKASLGQGQRSLIRHCNGHDGYVKALSILDGRYGDPDQLQARYLRELKALPKVQMGDSDSIQEYADQVLCLIAGFDEELGGSRLLIEELAEKLPLSEYANWRQWSDVEEKSNLEGFGEWISLRAKRICIQWLSPGTVLLRWKKNLVASRFEENTLIIGIMRTYEAIASAWTLALLCGSTTGMVIQTQNGAVQGTSETSFEGNEFFGFHSIPYAKAPVGNRRFRDPVPYGIWEGVLNATEDGPPCIQIPSFIENGTIGDEDCLWLSVFTPSLMPEANLAVVVWIHGGRWSVGSGRLASYGPHQLVDRGIVVVQLQYRLGAFGWLSTNDAVAPGNYGFRDQLLALKWVRDNIDVFGGNPSE
eukprot:snap_masked-scaffold1280_size50848-processed-gene-0.5 protein:Tk06599 transcript:snap_masked-scaffold1280_size50848-processed-gene-0.5-mRNA-1 annotation:"carboxylesterase"